MAYEFIDYNNGLEIAGNGTAISRIDSSVLATLILTFGITDEGKVFYKTDTNQYCFWNGVAIVNIADAGSSSDTQVIFNDNGVLAGDISLTYTKSLTRLRVSNRIDIWRGLNTNNDSTAIGFNALLSTQAGANSNTAVGANAGSGNLTGSTNTYVGLNAGFINTTGNNNVAVGNNTLLLNTASNNTAFGSNAGGNITSGTNNICIGVSANTQAAGNDNELVIGSSTSFVATNGAATTYFTTASALSSGSLPVNCGFIRIYLNGSFVKIPVYGN